MNPFEFPDNICRYTGDHTSDEDEVLQQLSRQTHLKTVHPQMLSGKVQGLFLSMVSNMIQPESILEIGTFTGYSAYCLTKGLKKNGTLVTIEVNEELEDMIRNFFQVSGIEDRTELIIGDARKVIPDLDGEFDLIFIDAHKEHYIEYYELCFPKLRPGGYLLADNVLWGGKVTDEKYHDSSAAALHAFNERIQQDTRMENVLLTIRDGIMLARKRPFV